MLPSTYRDESRYSERLLGEVKTINRDYAAVAKKLYFASGLLAIAGTYELTQGKYLAAAGLYAGASYLAKQGFNLDKKLKGYVNGLTAGGIGFFSELREKPLVQKFLGETGLRQRRLV